MDIFGQLLGGADVNALGNLGSLFGTDEQSVAKVGELGLPAMLEAMQKNASTPEGRASLAKALDDHAGAQYAGVGEVDDVDGDKILGHLFGNEKEDVTQKIGAMSGIGAGAVGGILAKLAPMLMGFLGNKKKEKQQDDGFDLGDLAGGLGGLGGLGSILSGGLGGGLGDLLGGKEEKAQEKDDKGGLGDLLGGLFK